MLICFVGFSFVEYTERGEYPKYNYKGKCKMNGCKITMPSMTAAQRAHNLLKKWKIASNIVKISAERSPRGCAYALEISCSQVRAAKNLLDATGTPSGVVIA